VLGGLRYKKLAMGAGTCGITQAGALHCWGIAYPWPGGTNNPPQRLGDSSLQFIDVDASQGDFCALTSNSRAFCW
jgi:hypothetical protein